MTLNKIAKQSYKDARKRELKGANISTSTLALLKHTATEVIEATDAYTTFTFSKSLDELEAHSKQFASELADIICCVAIIAEAEDIDLDKAVMECLKKNHARAEGKGDKK